LSASDPIAASGSASRICRRSAASALAVLHDRCVLRERLDKARDVGPETRVQLCGRDVGVLEHIVQQTRNDHRRRLTAVGEQLANRDRMLDRLTGTRRRVR
jgi:hypothetical protein